MVRNKFFKKVFIFLLFFTFFYKKHCIFHTAFLPGLKRIKFICSIFSLHCLRPLLCFFCSFFCSAEQFHPRCGGAEQKKLLHFCAARTFFFAEQKKKKDAKKKAEQFQFFLLCNKKKQHQQLCCSLLFFYSNS